MHGTAALRLSARPVIIDAWGIWGGFVLADESSTAQAEPATLHRTLGPLGIAFLTFSALSPAVSVYIFGDGLIHLAGTGTVLALLIGGTIAAVLGLLYAEIGAAFPNAGGIYPALVQLLGPWLAFPYIGLLLAIGPAGMAFQVLGFADYVRVLLPGLPAVPIMLVCLAAAAGIAILSVRTGALVTGIFLLLETLALTILSGVTAWQPARTVAAAIAHPVTLSPESTLIPAAASTLALGVVSAVYACGGASWATYFAEDMHEADRRIGRIIAIISPLAALTIAGPLILAVLSAPDLHAALASSTPVATILRQRTAPWLSTLVSAGVAVAVFNAIVASVMGYGRLFYATARDGIWPGAIGEPLARINRRFRSPMIATLVLCGAAALMLTLGSRALLVLISNLGVLEFILLGLAVIIGRRRGLVGQRFRLALHPLIPVLAIATSIGLGISEWIDVETGRPSLLLLIVWVAASLAYYRWWLAPRGGIKTTVAIVTPPAAVGA